MITQRTYLHEHNNLNASDARAYTLYSFFGHDTAGGPVIVGTDYVRDTGATDNRVSGWWVDPDRTVLAVLTEDRSLAVSSAWTYTADGHARRTDWRAVTDLGDGVRAVRATPSDDLQLASQPFRAYADIRGVVGGPLRESAGPLTGQDRRLVGGGAPPSRWQNGAVLDVGPRPPEAPTSRTATSSSPLRWTPAQSPRGTARAAASGSCGATASFWASESSAATRAGSTR